VPLDFTSIISDEAARIVDGYEQDRSARVPWSDRWSVGTVARHVAGTHHVVAGIVEGRPDASFGLFAELASPEKDAPEFVEWFRSGTESLLGQLSSAPANDECWSWYADGRRVGWWARRMAHEAVVHRADIDAAVGERFSVAAEIAADGIDEYLDVFVAASRAGANSPAGPTIAFECSDTTDCWCLDLSEAGGRRVTREPRSSSLVLRGTAEDLLLAIWGRVPLSETDASGDVELLGRWPELIPPM